MPNEENKRPFGALPPSHRLLCAKSQIQRPFRGSSRPRGAAPAPLDHASAYSYRPSRVPIARSRPLTACGNMLYENLCHMAGKEIPSGHVFQWFVPCRLLSHSLGVISLDDCAERRGERTFRGSSNNRPVLYRLLSDSFGAIGVDDCA